MANDVLEKRPLAADDLDAEAQAAKRKLEAALASMPAEGENLLKFIPNRR